MERRQNTIQTPKQNKTKYMEAKLPFGMAFKGGTC